MKDLSVETLRIACVGIGALIANSTEVRDTLIQTGNLRAADDVQGEIVQYQTARGKLLAAVAEVSRG